MEERVSRRAGDDQVRRDVLMRLLLRAGRRLSPTSEQRLLLRAALLEGDAGREAWTQWRTHADLDRLDAGSRRLLPQLYRNLPPEAAGDPLVEKLKGVYRHAWSANGVALQAAGRALGALAQAGVRTAVVDGTALVLRWYGDHGARLIDSIAIMVPVEDVPEASLALARKGWGSRAWMPGSRPGPYAGHVHLPGPGRPVDLLWDPFPEGCTPEIHQLFWADAVPTEMVGVPSATLAPTDELLRICVRAARWDADPPFRRLADAMILLRSDGDRVDWARLSDLALRARTRPSVLISLSLLRDLLHAPVPPDTIERLETEPLGLMEQVEQVVRQAPRARLGRLPDLIFRYWRQAAPEFAGARPPGLARYLQGAWGVRRLWQLPVVAIGKGVRRVVRTPDPS